jgi:hypothetical protein
MDVRDIPIALLCVMIARLWWLITDLRDEINRDHNCYENWMRGLEARKQNKPEVEIEESIED